MVETGIEPYFALVDGKKLRYGYTTGTCAAAAAQGATWLLLTGRAPERVVIVTPKGITLRLEPLHAEAGPGFGRCAVKKFSGDDPDVTDGVLVFARATFGEGAGVFIEGGEGVGRVTKPGLQMPVGAAAINPGPRKMIEEAVLEALSQAGEARGVAIEISVPQGAELAQKTFNPRLGIQGGISILGTSGIVEPMSEEALLSSIRLEIRQRRALGDDPLILAPGNYGADFLRGTFGIREERIVKCSNFIGKALDMAREEGFCRVLLVGHIGKLVKLSGGLMNTHSREGDARGELMAGCALRAGADGNTARAILDCVTTDEMLRLLEQHGLLPGAMAALGERIQLYIQARVRDSLQVGVLVFSLEAGPLCWVGPARDWLKSQNEEENP